MNAGAAEANGDVLLFLHADTRLPLNAVSLIKNALERNVTGGAFHLRFEPFTLRMRLQAFCSNLRSYYAVPFGDQALFVRRDFFVRTGGFPEWLLMEDVALARRMKKNGRLRMIRTPVITSARRYQRNGFWRTVVKNQILLAAFYAGVSPDRLTRHYPYD
jgi:rSAM/selenodomain-associated transferase 2